MSQRAARWDAAQYGTFAAERPRPAWSTIWAAATAFMADYTARIARA